MTHGQCSHFFCLECLGQMKGGTCPAPGCSALAHPNAVRPHKTIHSFIKSVYSMEKLLGEEVCWHLSVSFEKFLPIANALFLFCYFLKPGVLFALWSNYCLLLIISFFFIKPNRELTLSNYYHLLLCLSRSRSEWSATCPQKRTNSTIWRNL